MGGLPHQGVLQEASLLQHLHQPAHSSVHLAGGGVHASTTEEEEEEVKEMEDPGMATSATESPKAPRRLELR